MRVSIAQMEIVSGDVDNNYKLGMHLIQKAKNQNSDLVLLPEVWTTGFAFKKLGDLSKTTFSILEEIKKISHNIAICGTYVVKINSKIYNIFYAIHNGKIIFEYTKSILFSVTGEDRYFEAGSINQNNTFDFSDTKIGVSICYELRFPEFFRKSAVNGATIHLHPAIWPMGRVEHWQTLTRARSIENQFYLLTANGCKTSGKWQLAGNSSVYNPWGEVLVNLQNAVGISTIDIDTNLIENTRKNLPSLEDSHIFYR